MRFIPKCHPNLGMRLSLNQDFWGGNCGTFPGLVVAIFVKMLQNLQNKLGDAIAISKSETINDSLTDPPTGVGARRCHRIWKARKAKKREFETFGAKWRLLPLHCNNGATMGVLVCIQKWKAFFNAQWRGGKKLSHTHRSVPMSLGRPFFF